MGKAGEKPKLCRMVSPKGLAGWPMIIGWVAMIIFALHSSTHMVAAGDTWVAMACGRHFINHGVDTVEPFSANSHDPGPTREDVKKWPDWARTITNWVGFDTVKKWHPTGWINQNWLTHVLFYWLTHLSPVADADTWCFNTLVYWKFALYILTVICVYYTGRLLGAHPALSAAFACFAMFVGRTFFDIRPAGFSNLLVAVFLLILALTTYRNALYIWLCVPLAVLWCNLHGGYLYIFIIFIPYFLFNLHALPKKWTICISSISSWLLLLMFNMVKMEASVGRPFMWISLIVLVLIAAGIIITHMSMIRSHFIYGFYTFAWLIVGLLLITTFRDEVSALSNLGIFLGLLSVMLIVTLGRNLLVPVRATAPAHIFGAGLAGLVFSIIFNPFHFTNLTHTFVISVSEHAEMWRGVNEWHPAFEWSNPVGDEIPFFFMFLICCIVLVLWALTLAYLKDETNKLKGQKNRKSAGFKWPRVDLAMIVIAVITVYMAICSRRFITIGAIAACPLLAAFIYQIICSISAIRNYRRNGRFEVNAMPASLQVYLIFAAIAVVSFFGLFWGLKFKHVYLDPWPTDTKLTSVFMRMTASDVKPFYAGEFIRDNQLEGKMFNYWTEGGFIAYAQDPDPETGRTPLRLFMDGRAQAAYEPAAYKEWSNIMFGGQITHLRRKDAKARGRRLNSKDYLAIGNWISEQLERHHVWVVMMPRKEFNNVFVKGVQHSPDWRVAFVNGKQILFVDMKTERGKKLFDGIITGETIYPDSFSENLTKSYRYLNHRVNGGFDRAKGLSHAIKACKENPSSMPMQVIVRASKFKSIAPRVYNFCRNYFDEFMENKKKWSKEDGYHNRMLAALIASSYLKTVAHNQKNEQLENFYIKEINKMQDKLNQIRDARRW